MGVLGFIYDKIESMMMILIPKKGNLSAGILIILRRNPLAIISASSVGIRAALHRSPMVTV
jgi:hypothetical protein